MDTSKRALVAFDACVGEPGMANQGAKGERLAGLSETAGCVERPRAGVPGAVRLGRCGRSADRHPASAGGRVSPQAPCVPDGGAGRLLVREGMPDARRISGRALVGPGRPGSRRWDGGGAGRLRPRCRDRRIPRDHGGPIPRHAALDRTARLGCDADGCVARLGRILPPVRALVAP
jgi:hypothetical protein